VVESFPTLPSGHDFETFPVRREDNYSTIGTDYESGHLGTRSRWSKKRRRFPISARNISYADYAFMDSFVQAMFGGTTAFNYTPPVPLSAPYLAPTLTQAAGGAKGARDYYVQITWYDGSLQTTVSQESSISVLANQLMTVTLPEAFPTGVTSARIFVGVTGTGTEKYENAISTHKGSWTEPAGALTQGAAAPSTNVFYEVVLGKLAPGFVFAPSKNAPYTYDVDLTIVEVF